MEVEKLNKIGFTHPANLRTLVERTIHELEQLLDEYVLSRLSTDGATSPTSGAVLPGILSEDVRRTELLLQLLASLLPSVAQVAYSSTGAGERSIELGLLTNFPAAQQPLCDATLCFTMLVLPLLCFALLCSALRCAALLSLAARPGIGSSRFRFHVSQHKCGTRGV